jgi:hypothetical protein
MPELVLKYWQVFYQYFIPVLANNVGYSFKPCVLVTSTNNCLDLCMKVQKATMSYINHTLNTSSGAIIKKFAVLWAA